MPEESATNRYIRDFIAHKKQDDGEEQSLYDHLIGTANLARSFATSFNSGDFAYSIGLCHDLGKYSKDFQRRIRGENIRVDHSTAGGQYLYSLRNGPLGKMAAYCVVGHHGGLPNGGSSADTAEKTSLCGRLKRDIPAYGNFKADFNNVDAISRIAPPGITVAKQGAGYSIAFLIRMVFSALVDADWLDTENFMSSGKIERGGFDSLEVLQDKLLMYLSKLKDKSHESSLNVWRNELLNNCIEAADSPHGLFTLTAPTGSGKTLSSISFAMKHVIKNKHDRVIYVVPYNTIIEQNAKVFEDIFGVNNVLQHHSGIDYEAKENSANPKLQYQKLLATENWDAPLIVTSSVRFFESLYGNKPSICRKLHNISNSLIILDEAQMIPLSYLIPCVRALRELVTYYGCTVVLATATQSSLDEYFEPLIPTEIVRNPKDMYEFFQRVTYEKIEGVLNDEGIANLISSHEQVLCVVNTRKRAQAVTQILGDDALHLSTTMVPIHRSDVLKRIRDRLNSGLPCKVISTSLIEAGVDIDFPVVYREKSGLDSIIQAAGRCNREGKRQSSDSKVYVFSTEGSSPRQMAQNIGVYEEVARSFEDISSLTAIKSYFEQLRYVIGRENLDKNTVVSKFEEGEQSILFPFQDVSQTFRLIDEITRTIYVPYNDDARRLLDQFRYGGRSRELYRKIQSYSVSLYEHDLKILNDLGALEHIDEEIHVLQEAYYNDHYGVTLSPGGGMALFG